MGKEKRLAHLEEATNQRSRQPVPAGRSRPSDHEETRALDESWEAYYELYSRYGWSREEVDQDLEWAKELTRRCDQSGLQDWQIVGDMCAFVDSLELPVGEVLAAFDAYQGPGHWRPSDQDKRLPRGRGVLMAQCQFNKRGGDPCGGIAMGSHGGCFAPDPDFELDRRRLARRGGKQGGRGRTNPATVDLQRLQNRFEQLAEDVLSGSVDRARAAIACQLLNGARSAIQANLKAREVEDFEERLSALEKRRGA